MKKIIAFSFILINSYLGFSQSSSFDINILINEKVKIIEIINDSLIFQEFYLKEKINYVQQNFQFNKKGQLETKIEVPSSNNETYIKVVYKNIKNNNLPFLIKKENVKNILLYPENFKGVKIKKTRKLLNKAKNIYIIESDSITGFYVLKKVFLLEKKYGL